MALAVILFPVFYPLVSQPQCLENQSGYGSETMSGVTNGSETYYRNLLIQDIGLAENRPFNEVDVRFDYIVHYTVSYCHEDYYELVITSLDILNKPVYYRGVDISPFIKPEKADIVLRSYNEFGILSDSVIFYNVNTRIDSTHYALIQIPINDEDRLLNFRFANARFYFTRESYDVFRDRIMEIDRFFASLMLADSMINWTSEGFLEETTDIPLLLLRNLEIARIIRQLKLPGHDTALQVFPINDRLKEKYIRLKLLHTRYSHLLEIQIHKQDRNIRLSDFDHLAKEHVSILRYYDRITFNGDYRNMEFMEKVSSPVDDNSSLVSISRQLETLFPGNLAIPGKLSEYLITEYLGQGERLDSAGNQIRALKYFEAAYKMAVLAGYHSSGSNLFDRVCLTKQSVIESYLAISKRAFAAGNPSMSVSYYKNALALKNHKRTGQCSKPAIDEFQVWLFGSLEEKARELLRLKQYRKALSFLDEVNNECDHNPGYDCPGDLQRIIGEAKEGIYLELLEKAARYLSSEDFIEAEMAVQQAKSLRLGSGLMIPADKNEIRMEESFRQLHYDEFIEEGLKNIDWQEFNIALYYFNKATMLENYSLKKNDDNLFVYRQSAARQVIGSMISDARAKVISFDFEGFQVSMNRIAGMLDEYGFRKDDELSLEYLSLLDNAKVSLCRKVREEFDTLLAGTLSAREAGNYILARRMAEQAVSYSLDHMECGLDDSRAWLEKVSLEPLALFQEKNSKLSVYEGIEPQDYQDTYFDASGFYYRNKLLSKGITLETLHQKVLQSDNNEFLHKFLQHYIRQRSMEEGLKVLKRLRELGEESSAVNQEQKQLAEIFVQRDIVLDKTGEPWKILEGYVGDDKWFSDFRKGYRWNWISASGGKLRYWPVIWKK